MTGEELRAFLDLDTWTETQFTCSTSGPRCPWCDFTSPHPDNPWTEGLWRCNRCTKIFRLAKRRIEPMGRVFITQRVTQ